MWAAEANLAASLISYDRFHLAALGGFRFLRLEDEVQSGEQFHVAPNVPVFGGSSVNLQDEFRTVNCFYGGQVGLETGVQFGLLTLDFRGKIGLGQMHQVADVNGVTDVLHPDGSRIIFQGGLFALRSNIGRHQRDELTFIPEVGLNGGLQLTRHLKLYPGYSFLWVSTVARAGEQIDPVVNVTQFPIRSGNGPLVGPARPAFNFDETDFWAQGLNFGLELRYCFVDGRIRRRRTPNGVAIFMRSNPLVRFSLTPWRWAFRRKIRRSCRGRLQKRWRRRPGQI